MSASVLGALGLNLPPAATLAAGVPWSHVLEQWPAHADGLRAISHGPHAGLPGLVRLGRGAGSPMDTDEGDGDTALPFLFVRDADTASLADAKTALLVSMRASLAVLARLYTAGGAPPPPDSAGQAFGLLQNGEAWELYMMHRSPASARPYVSGRVRVGRLTPDRDAPVARAYGRGGRRRDVPDAVRQHPRERRRARRVRRRVSAGHVCECWRPSRGWRRRGTDSSARRSAAGSPVSLSRAMAARRRPAARARSRAPARPSAPRAARAAACARATPPSTSTWAYTAQASSRSRTGTSASARGCARQARASACTGCCRCRSLGRGGRRCEPASRAPAGVRAGTGPSIGGAGMGSREGSECPL